MSEQKPRKKKKRRMRLPPGLGSVHLIGDEKQRRKPWRARVQSHVELDVKTGTAKKKYITVGCFATEMEAIEALMNYRKNPFTLDASSCTFEELFERWKEKKYPDLSFSGQTGYNSAYKNSQGLYKMKMRDIKAYHLDEVMQQQTGGYQVQNRLRSFWSQLFKYAMENDIIEKNYAEFVKLKDKPTETTRTAIPPEGRAKIWQAVQAGDQAAELAMIYIYTGMRPSELLEIEKKNVDLDARIMVGGLKTEAGKNRRIPIHRTILPFIERLMQGTGDYLVPRKAKRSNIRTIYQAFMLEQWQPLMQRLGMEEYTPHYCRHTCATMLREADVAEDLKKLILGHKSEDITDRYTHHPDSMLLEAIDKLPAPN